MSVFRVEKNENYTTMSNYHLRDERLSLKAKGLLSLFLSLPDSWKYSITGLASICREGVSGIRTGLTELEDAGYLTRERQRDEHGMLRENLYVIYELPQDMTDQSVSDNPLPEEYSESEKPVSEIPALENPTLDNPILENPTLDNPTLENPTSENPSQEKPTQENRTQLNKDISSKEKTKKDLNKTKKEKEVRRRYGEYNNVLLTDAELRALQKEFPLDYSQRIERLSEYVASTGKAYKNHLATIRSWASRDRQTANQKYSHDNYRCEEGESL